MTAAISWPLFFMVACPHELLRTDEVNDFKTQFLIQIISQPHKKEKSPGKHSLN
jgi:hypothetical protein